MASSSADDPSWKIYVGGVWSGYVHEDVRQWLWEATTIAPLSIKCWKKGTDATKQSVFVGYATEEQARSALRILQQRPQMWGQRISVFWGRDNPRPGTTPKSAPAVPKYGPAVAASSSRPTLQDQAVQTEDVEKLDKQIASGQEKDLVYKVDQGIDANQEDEMPSPASLTEAPSTQQLEPTERAVSPTRSPPTSPASSGVGTAYGHVPEEVLERIQVKRELEEAEEQCKKLKKEVKEEQGD